MLIYFILFCSALPVIPCSKMLRVSLPGMPCLPSVNCCPIIFPFTNHSGVLFLQASGLTHWTCGQASSSALTTDLPPHPPQRGHSRECCVSWVHMQSHVTTTSRGGCPRNAWTSCPGGQPGSSPAEGGRHQCWAEVTAQQTPSEKHSWNLKKKLFSLTSHIPFLMATKQCPECDPNALMPIQGPHLSGTTARAPTVAALQDSLANTDLTPSFYLVRFLFYICFSSTYIVSPSLDNLPSSTLDPFVLTMAGLGR